MLYEQRKQRQARDGERVPTFAPVISSAAATEIARAIARPPKPPRLRVRVEAETVRADTAGARAPERERELAASRRAVANAEAGVRARAEANRAAPVDFGGFEEFGQKPPPPLPPGPPPESAWIDCGCGGL